MNIGFSTGSLAYGNFNKALAFLKGKKANVIELSALREKELIPLINSIDSLDLQQFEYVSFHAPSKRTEFTEQELVGYLKQVTDRRIPVVLHPDVIENFEIWNALGEYLLIENMDVRKPVGRTTMDLEKIFYRLPAANFCFDLAHVRQVDPSMQEGYMMLNTFSGKLKQLHISDVNTISKHESLNFEAIISFRKISELIPKDIPIILESPVTEKNIDSEITNAILIFDDVKFKNVLQLLNLSFSNNQIYSNQEENYYSTL